MPTAAELRAAFDKLHQEQARSKAYYQEGVEMKKALTHYEERIKELEDTIAASPVNPVAEPWMVALYVNNGFLVPLKETLTRQLVYTERQMEGYARILASIPVGNAAIRAYYDQCEGQVNGLRELISEIEKALR